ncbi:MAG TPA: nitroreductase family protein [Bacteroidales bacterium]|nr:nitroreductase family protein [Bacteroidales bacterium]
MINQDMQDFFSLLKKRQSVRRYTNTPVETSKLHLCLEAARLAPSASNSQPWTFVVANEPNLVKALGEACRGPLGTFNRFVTQAPVIITIVLEKPKTITELGGRIKSKDYPLIDIGIAAIQLCLQAEALGLGSCMIGWFDEPKVKQLLQIPESKSVGLIITLGYPPAGYPVREKVRKSFDAVVSFNKYPEK